MFSKTPRRRPSRLAIVTVASVALSIAAVPATATAAVRTVTIGDPQDMGQSTFDPNYCQAADLASATVSYNDAAGTVSASFTFYTDIAHYCGDRVDTGVTLSTNGG